jgi:Shedu protein SduA, N-terminal/Shedu protein SduA, C-terminal
VLAIFYTRDERPVRIQAHKGEEMNSERFSIESTSSQTAKVSAVTLREKDMTRLVFHPTLLDNPNNTEACVKGSLVFQKKGKNDTWVDWKDLPLTTLKKGEGVEFQLHSDEVLTLFRALANLYEFHAEHGIPLGKSTFVRAGDLLHRVSKLSGDELRSVVDADRVHGAKALRKLLGWATSLPNVEVVVSELEKANVSDLANISAITGIARLKAIVEVWKANSQNGDEEFWQQEFSTNHFLLEHLFAHPITVLKGKAYLGGKSISNKGGNVVDFLAKNSLTDNVVLIEIKTPLSPLLGKKYRSGCNISTELTGAVMQVLEYRTSFTKESQQLSSNSGTVLESAEPPCQVIIGNTSELDSEGKRRSFELFRRQFPGVNICTYDEVFERAATLIDLMSAG